MWYPGAAGKDKTHTRIHHYHHCLMNASRESEQYMGVPEGTHSRKLSSWSPHPTALVNSLITCWGILGLTGYFWLVTPPTTRLPPPTWFLLPGHQNSISTWELPIAPKPSPGSAREPLVWVQTLRIKIVVPAWEEQHSPGSRPQSRITEHSELEATHKNHEV